MRFCRILISVLLTLSVAGCAVPEQETLEYAELIKERNKQLGQALILHGRLLESFVTNDKVLDSEDFIAAEDILEEKLAAVGSITKLQALPLPSKRREIVDLHENFIEAAGYLRASVNSVTEGGYAPLYFVRAEKQWEEARRLYLQFSKRLFAMSGENTAYTKENAIPKAAESGGNR